MQDKYIKNKMESIELTEHIKQCILDSEMDDEYLSDIYRIDLEKIKKIRSKL